MKTAPSKTPTFYIFPPFLPKPPPQRWRPSRHKYRYICFMCQWISAVCPPMVRCQTAHLLCPSAFIFYPCTYILFPQPYIFHPSSYIFYPCIYIFHPSTYIFYPSTYILYIRCNSLPPRIRPVGVGVLPPHAKALDIGYKGLWLGSEDESCRFGTCLRSSGGHLPAFLTNSFCPICVIKRWLIIKRIAILLHKHRGSVHANVVFIRKNLPE
jgi:hypothetical protein